MNKIIEDEFYKGQIEFMGNGNATIRIEEKEFFIYKKNTKNSLHLDTVKVQVFKAEKKLEAKVIEVVSRFKTEFVGKVHIGKKSVFVIPDSNKIPVDFYIKGGLKAENDQKVLVELTKWDESKSPQAKITKILGDSGDNNAEMNSIMYEYNLPIDFPEEVKVESEKIPNTISEEEISNRRDVRNIPTFTIDPLEAKDFDDALSVKVINDDNIEIGVHIADVGHYIEERSELDKEALKRATSVYLVDRVVPMLPERLSNGICSLKPNEDRLAFSVIFNINKDGNIIKEWHGKTIINSNRRFVYDEVQDIIEGKEGDHKSEILILNNIAKRIRKKRIKDGSIEMGGIEVKFKLAEDNKKPIGVFFKEQKEANKLIEEFMLLANKSVAKLLSKAGWHNVYRVHDTPNLTKLEQLSNICKTFGYEVDFNNENKLKDNINRLLIDIKGKPEENMIETLVTRTMSKATYTIKNIGHYGLGFTHYSHFTSPIRRYPDLITHRILLNYLNKKKNGNPLEIEDKAKWCSAREIAAAKAQRDSIKYKQAEFLSDKIGQVFDGIVSSVTDWGMYVELIESKCEGMIRYQTLKGKWNIDTNNYTISNKKGDKIRLGDPVRVIVNGVDLEKKQIDFKMF